MLVNLIYILLYFHIYVLYSTKLFFNNEFLPCVDKY